LSLLIQVEVIVSSVLVVLVRANANGVATRQIKAITVFLLD
jgi:hypothetical protein